MAKTVPGMPWVTGWGGNWRASVCFGIPLGLGPLGGKSVGWGWGWAGMTLAERELHMVSTGRCCTYGAKTLSLRCSQGRTKALCI